MLSTKAPTGHLKKIQDNKFLTLKTLNNLNINLTAY